MAEEIKNTDQKTTSGKKDIWRDVIWLVVGFILGAAATWCIMAATLAGTLNQLESYISGMAAGQAVQEQTIENAE